jgi:uncharacterized membrane protein
MLEWLVAGIQWITVVLLIILFIIISRQRREIEQKDATIAERTFTIRVKHAHGGQITKTETVVVKGHDDADLTINFDPGEVEWL